MLGRIALPRAEWRREVTAADAAPALASNARPRGRLHLAIVSRFATCARLLRKRAQWRKRSCE
jgi:hypothetical protein